MPLKRLHYEIKRFILGQTDFLPQLDNFDCSVCTINSPWFFHLNLSSPPLLERPLQCFRLRYVPCRLVVKRPLCRVVARLRYSPFRSVRLGPEQDDKRCQQYQEVPEAGWSSFLSRLRKIRHGSAQIQVWEMFGGQAKN
jgi:hypothetical protein